MTSLTSGRFQPPLSLTEGNTVDFVFRLSNNGTLFTPPLTPVWIFGIKDANTPNGDFLIQVNSATVASGVYTFVVELASAELQAWLATATSQSYAAIQITDSANDIATAPLLCQIAPNQNDTGTTPTSANGTLNVSAGKTVTFPQSLTFPSALGTNGFQLTTDGAGALTWAASGALTDGDKGDITVSNSGATFTIDNDVVGLAQLAHMPTARVIGRTTAGNGSPELLTISGTGSVAMTNTPTLVTPVLGAATATSILASGDIKSTTGLTICENGFYADDAGALGMFFEGIPLTTVGVISGPTSNFEARFPAATGTVAVAATSATATQALFATATAGAPAYRAIATADIATALTTPGAIGATTAATSVKIANGSAASTALQIGAVSNGIYSPSGAGTDVGVSANGTWVAFWNSSWGLVARLPIIPLSNNGTSCGTSSVRWSGVYSVLGDFSGAVTCSTTLSVTGATTLGGGTAIAKLRHGSATLVAGTKTVTDTAITANSRIWINRFTDGGTLGDSYSITRSAGASFTITSKTANVTATLDTSVVSYLIIEP